MLEARAITRIAANRVRIRAGRSRVVAAVYRTAYGGFTAVAIELVLKAQGSSEPAVEDRTASAIEYLAELDLAIDPRPIAYLALTGGAVDDAAISTAIKLEIVEYRQSGVVPDRWQLRLRRLR